MTANNLCRCKTRRQSETRKIPMKTRPETMNFTGKPCFLTNHLDVQEIFQHAKAHRSVLLVSSSTARCWVPHQHQTQPLLNILLRRSEGNRKQNLAGPNSPLRIQTCCLYQRTPVFFPLIHVPALPILINSCDRRKTNVHTGTGDLDLATVWNEQFVPDCCERHVSPRRLFSAHVHAFTKTR